jgi:uncharacterized membrane-anchored protein
MTLTCKWIKDRTGALVMTWTGDEVSMTNEESVRPRHERREIK